MNITILKLAVASAVLATSSGAMASTNGGIIHFVGSIVEPPCSTGNFDGSQLNIHCEQRSAFDVTFQRVSTNASSPHATITLTRDGKPLGIKEAGVYRMALQGNAQLGLVAKNAAAGEALGPVIMTISYL
jgi:type 1 fimbria pilin